MKSLRSIDRPWRGARWRRAMWLCVGLVVLLPLAANSRQVKPPMAFVTGVVTHAGGAPLRGVSVTATDLTGQTHTTATSQQGFYALEVPVGVYALTAAAPGFVGGAKPARALIPGEVLMHADFTLTLGGTIFGTVFDHDGVTPIKGALVKAHARSTGATLETTTVQDGSFALSGLSAGQYQLTVAASGYEKAVVSTVEAALGQTIANIGVYLIPW